MAFNIASLTALASLAHSGIAVAQGLASTAPKLAAGAPALVSSGKAVVSDFGTIVADLRAGKCQDLPADIARAEADIERAFSAIKAEAAPIAELAGSSLNLPSLAGISAVLKAV